MKHHLFAARRPLGVWAAALLSLTLAAGCQPPRDDADADPAPAPEISRLEAVPSTLPGRHALTVAPPLEPADLDQMFGQGFTSTELLAAIRLRGVLRAPDALESEHIARLPDGARLAAAMTSPENVLTPEAAITRARFPDARFNPEPIRYAENPVRAVSASRNDRETANRLRTLQNDHVDRPPGGETVR